MPTYDYRCKSCDHEFELFQSMSDPVKKKCPSCGKSALERLIGTGAALVFKGSGFYQTDYRSESYKQAAKADSGGGESKGDTKGAGDAKSESKPGAKSEAGKTATEKTPASKGEAPKADKPAKSKPDGAPAKGKK
ncbi:MAG: zinc ribbon domain-containing protein [Phycisphaerales bacterium]|nr:zinc ribbon domain-containing protein [Phycisphaerales bacterium]